MGRRRGFVCAACGGLARLSKATISLRFDTGLVDPLTRRPVMVTRSFKGLGTWKCLNGCPKRKLMVERITGSGKENEFVNPGRKPQVEAWPVTRPIAVKRA